MVKRKAPLKKSQRARPREDPGDLAFDPVFQLGQKVYLRIRQERYQGEVFAYVVRLGASELRYEVRWEDFGVCEHLAQELTLRAPIE